MGPTISGLDTSPTLSPATQALKRLSINGNDASQDPLGFNTLLGQHYDQRVAQDRSTEDAQPLPPGANPGQQQYFNAFNRGQQDAAMGPQGYNRQWAPFFESLNMQAEGSPKFKLNLAQSGLPMESSGPLTPAKKGPLAGLAAAAPAPWSLG